METYWLQSAANEEMRKEIGWSDEDIVEGLLVTNI